MDKILQEDNNGKTVANGDCAQRNGSPLQNVVGLFLVQITEDGLFTGAIETLGVQSHCLILHLHNGVADHGNDNGNGSHGSLDHIAFRVQTSGALSVHDLVHFLTQNRDDLEHIDEDKGDLVRYTGLIHSDAQIGGIDGFAYHRNRRIDSAYRFADVFHSGNAEKMATGCNAVRFRHGP